jgi:hypothetical protein
MLGSRHQQSKNTVYYGGEKPETIFPEIVRYFSGIFPVSVFVTGVTESPHKSIDAITRRIQQLHFLNEQCRLTRPPMLQKKWGAHQPAKCRGAWDLEQDALRRKRAEMEGTIL